MNVTVFNPHGHSIPRVPFSRIAKTILGTGYVLSVIFVDTKTSARLNKRYRTINRPTDILSFALDATTGELYISMNETRKKARAFGRSGATYLPYLFIHGCLHLKGLSHGRRMDLLEHKYCKAFSIPPLH